MTNVGDEVSVKKRKTKTKLRQERNEEELRQLLSHRMGRNFIWNVLSQCGVYRSSFNGDHTSTIFNEGKRSIGLWIMEQIMAADDSAYLRMQREAKDDI